MPVVRPLRPVVAGSLLVGLAAFAFARRFEARRRSAARPMPVAPLTDLGVATELSITPLAERLTTRADLPGEAGLSYLVRADDVTLLLDVGLGPRNGRWRAIDNAHTLGVDLTRVRALAISHAHPDHVGGPGPWLRRSVSVPAELEASGASVFVPPYLEGGDGWHSFRTPVRLASGVALTGALDVPLFWLGTARELALIVNVQHRGLVIITGCGHPGLERLLRRASDLVPRVPIYGVVGGLHLPVRGQLVQACLGNADWPWRLPSRGDVDRVVDIVRSQHVQLLGVSGHDSSDWTLARLARALPREFRAMRVGEQLTVRGDAGPALQPLSPIALSPGGDLSLDALLR